MSQSLSRFGGGPAPALEANGFWNNFIADLATLVANHPDYVSSANMIVGTPGDDRFGGTRGDDIFDLQGGNDVARGGAGNDVIFGGPGNDTARGGAGDDQLIMGSGGDKADGGRGDDWLSGGVGGDQLNGGNGNDHLDGGPQNDILRTGGGDDTIFFEDGDGADVVLDFDRRGNDVLVIDADGFDDFSDLDGRIEDLGTSIVIRLNGADAIRLVGVDPEDLTPDDFIFV